MTRPARMLGVLALVGAGLATTSLATSLTARPAGATPGGDVFLLGDSVTESLAGGTPSTFDAIIRPTYPDAIIDGRTNRRTVGGSTYQGQPVTSGLDEIKANAGRIGDVIVVELGYNDCVSPGFPAAIDQILTELTSQDVPTVLWSMMSTLNRPEYASCNSALSAATSRWPTLRLIDWDAYSRTHPDWFANDGVGVHLDTAGRTAYATFLRDQLDQLPGIGVRPPAAQHCAASVAIGHTVATSSAIAPITPSTGLLAARSPVRVLDTRAGRPLGAGRVIELQVAGRSGVPAAASAAVLNVTADQPCGPGYVTVYPCGGSPPDASNLNLAPGTARPNHVVVQLGGSGRVCLTSSVQTDLIADLSGWFAANAPGRFQARAPQRVLDTRLGTGAPAGKVASNSAITVTLPGAPDGARAAVLNVTVTQAAAAGFVTVWPEPAGGACAAGGAPDASNLNFVAGQTVANLVTVGAGGDGRICVKTTAAAHLLADLSGWYGGAGAALTAARPERVLDTRLGTGAPAGLLANNAVVALHLGSLPVGAVAVVLNLTAAEPLEPGFVKVWPAASDGSCIAAAAPDVSNLNVAKGQTAPNLVTVAMGGNRTVCASTTARLHLIADVFGVYA